MKNILVTLSAWMTCGRSLLIKLLHFIVGCFGTSIHGDDLPAGLDYAVFDYAVNSGTGHAAKALQQAVGATPDGTIGRLTMAAVNSADIATTIDKICNGRLVYLQSLNTWKYYYKTWGARVASVKQRAHAML
jgi:lysozyme family protein